MNQSNWKFLGVDCLYLLSCVIVSTAGAAIQLIGREYVGEWSSLLADGETYSYRFFAYVFGLIIYISYLIVSYRKFYSGKHLLLSHASIMCKALHIVIAFIFAVIMLAAMMLIIDHFMGLNVNMIPQWMMLWTVFGWPLILLLYMVLVVIIKRPDAAKKAE